MEVRKEIIRTGKHTYLGQNGKPQVLDVTPEKIEHYFKSGRDMLAAGLPIPIPLEHDPDVNVVSAADKAAHLLRNNAGEVKRFESDTIKDKSGNDITRLMSVLDIKDDAIGKKVNDGSIRWVSPWINSFTDGNGKDWNEVISHVALTSRPRIHDQQPFDSVVMAFSQLAGSKLVDKGFALPRAGRLKSDGKPEYPMAFSLMKFAFDKEAPSDDDEDSDDDADPFEEDSAEDDAAEATGGEPDPAASAMAGEMPGNEAGDVSFEELIPHLLEMHGIHVPAGGKGKEFLKALVQGLLVSAKAMAATDGGADDSVLGDPAADLAANDPAKPKGPIVQESPPMYMSMEQIKKIKDPEKRQLASMLFSLQEETGALRKNKLEEAKRFRDQRIQRISKFVSAQTRDEIMQDAANPSMAFSLDKKTGSVIDPMARMLTAFEREIRGMPELLKTGVKLSEEPHPVDGDMLTDAQAEALANGQMRKTA